MISILATGIEGIPRQKVLIQSDLSYSHLLSHLGSWLSWNGRDGLLLTGKFYDFIVGVSGRVFKERIHLGKGSRDGTYPRLISLWQLKATPVQVLTLPAAASGTIFIFPAVASRCRFQSWCNHSRRAAVPAGGIFAQMQSWVATGALVEMLGAAALLVGIIVAGRTYTTFLVRAAYSRVTR